MIKKIHQIYISENNHRPGEFVQEKMNRVKQLYSDWEYNLYDNERCRQEINSVFGKKVVDLYDTLNAFTYRTDLARYCILYKYGGQYFDASICPEFKLEFDNTAILYKPPSEWANAKLIDPGVVIFNTINHPFLLTAIQKCAKNVRNKNYGNGVLDVTGPTMLGKINEYDNITYGYCKFITPEQKAAFLGNVMHWKYKPEGTTLESFNSLGVNDYNKMWIARTVFKEN